MKKLQFYRFFFYWIYTFFAIGVPILLVADKYALVVSESKYKVTGMGIIICIVLLFYFRGQLKDLIETMDEGNTKIFLKESFRVFPILLLYFALRFAEIQMANFKFIVLWSFISNIIASTFQVYHFKYLRLVKGGKKC